jgi:cytochrome oxidase assembly protein ShyY1
MRDRRRSLRAERGITLIGLLLWAILIAFVALMLVRAMPTVNEFATIQRAVRKIAREGPVTVPEIRAAFDRQREVEYSIVSITGKDLQVTKENDEVVIRFAYDKELEILAPVYLLIKYEGSSK